MLRISFILYFLLGFSYLVAQQVNSRTDLCPPLTVPLVISGNYGDIRSTSFHFGIDYTTNGQRGLPVPTIDSGYIARIKVEPGGYGKAIYINHKNGITSVYAHLDSFSSSITRFVKEMQYKSQSFSVDLLIDSGKYPVKKCEIIGYSGNSGQSTGPHLHFELRKTKNQNTIQPFIFAFHSKDTIPPIIKKVLLYSPFNYLTNEPIKAIHKSCEKFAINYRNAKYFREYLSDDSVLEVPARFYLGISAWDYLVPGEKAMSFYVSRIKLDGKVIFELVFDEIPFTETSAVNGIIDYQRKFFQKENVYLQFLYPNFTITPVKKAINNGLIELDDSLVHFITVEAADVSGNQSMFGFKVRRQSITLEKSEKLSVSLKNAIVHAGKTHVVNKEGIKVIFSPNSLFMDCIVTVRKNTRSGLLPGFWVEVGHEAIPLKSPFMLEFPITNFPRQLWPKIRVVRINGDKYVSIGGEIETHHIRASSKTFGNFTIALDTIPPTVQFINLKENEKAKDYILIRMRDNLSGIKSWAGYIDGKWVLFEYDKKNDEIRYVFDEYCLPTGQKHELTVSVEDNCGNKTLKKMNFVY
ncbi:MAG: M23 family metallopeptidase [Bacteroidales bacterium]|nr:M23 family metallopeptidase [Bacteroidales bacterium]